MNKTCTVCNCRYESIDPMRNVCFNCSKIDYEKMWRERTFEVGRLKQENAQLKEALRKCGQYEWIEDEQDSKCRFCGNWWEEDCKDDCEYIQLTKESEDK